MSFALDLLRRLVPNRPVSRSTSRRKPTHGRVRRQIEILEDRRLLTGFWVSGAEPVYEDGGAYAVFTVGCSEAGQYPASVEYRTGSGSATSGSDFGAASGSLTFTTNSSTTVSVAILDDAITEEDESFSLELFNPVNAPINIAQAAGTIRLNDHAPLLDVSDQEVDEFVQLMVSLAGTDVDQPTETLTYTLVSGPAGATVESSGVFTWTPLEPHGNHVYQATVRVTDSGSPNKSSMETFSITVNEVNAAPTTSGLSDVRVDEDSADTVVDVRSAFDDAEDTSAGLSYSIADNSNPELFNALWIDSAGQLHLDYALNAFGASSITIRATDSGGLSVETTMNVEVNPVNDAPVISGFSVGYDPVYGWLISGSVTDVDDDVEGWSISFGGILASYGLSASVQADGSFGVVTALTGLGTGHAQAWTSDPHGAASNIAEYSV